MKKWIAYKDDWSNKELKLRVFTDWRSQIYLKRWFDVCINLEESKVIWGRDKYLWYLEFGDIKDYKNGSLAIN